MLSLWTRVAQARGSCRCPQCVSVAQGVARRAGTSAARRPQYWTSSTLWYSGIFAAAATWDAMFKVQRREKWDKAIAEIKEELGDYDGFEADLMLQAQARKREEKSRAKYGYTLHGLVENEHGGGLRRPDVRMSQMQEHEGTRDDIAALHGEDSLQEAEAYFDNEKSDERKIRRVVAKNISQEDEDATILAQEKRRLGTEQRKASAVRVFEGDDALQELAANLDSSSKRKSIPRWPANTGSDTNPHWLPPQSIYAPDWFKRRHENRGWSTYKVERCMLSTDIFLLRTWNELRRRGMSEDAAQAVPTAYTNYITMPEHELYKNIAQKEADLDLLERMGANRYNQGLFKRSSGDVPLCRYHVDEHGEFHDSTRALNESFRALVQQTEAGTHTMSAFMAKVSYSLSLSTAPPNIDTYNTLLVGLYNFRQVKHTEHVIHSLLRTRARPNEVTLATVLNFHTATGDASNFKWWVQRMRGDCGGLMNASPTTTSLDLVKGRLVHHDNGKNGGLGTIVQLPYPTPMVFGALIKGVLAFSGFEAALKICQSMAHEGWSLCISGLGTMLRDCTDRKDWTSGLTVWKQIQALKWKSTRYSSNTWTSETIGLHTFTSMLQLCCRCGQRSAFEDIMDQAVRAHPDAVKDIIELVRSDKPPVGKWNVLDAECVTSLHDVCPARKWPVTDSMMALRSMDSNLLHGIQDADEVVPEVLGHDVSLDDLRDCWEDGSFAHHYMTDKEELT